MSKHLVTIGYEIPGFSDNYVGFTESFSLMDADVVLVSTKSINPTGDWVSFGSGGGCYDMESSKKFEQRVSHLKKELTDFLNSGKTAIIFLSSKDEIMLAQSVSSPRKNERNYTTRLANNYEFLPINIGTLTSASGAHINFSGYSVFSVFDERFHSFLKYKLYIENSKAFQIIYSGKDLKKTLGAVYRVGAGHLVVLPMLEFDSSGFLVARQGKGQKRWLWNKKGLAFGNSLVHCILDIDKTLVGTSEKTPAPDWITEKQYLLKKEIEIADSINEKLVKIAAIEKEIKELNIILAEELKLKDLLFENGKPLEVAVIKALKLLGYQAENFDDGDLEMDQIIISPEHHRYIGECEGKDNKDIDITKFRQLQDALSADFAREEVQEKAFGILFGNAERLKDPKQRKLDFTSKCKSGAAREKIALIKTIDLFSITRYLLENNDEEFKKNCRDAIHKHLGKVVIFPELPETDKNPP